MKQALVFITRAFFSGLLIVVPIYLAILLLLKGMKSVVGLVPLARCCRIGSRPRPQCRWF